MLAQVDVLRRSVLEQHALYWRESARSRQRLGVGRAWPFYGAASLLVLVLFVLGAWLERQSSSSFSSTLCLLSPLLMFTPSLFFWAVPLGMTLGPVIVRERVERTWETLLITPQDIDLIVLCKTRAALLARRELLRFLRAFVALVGVVVGTGFAFTFFDAVPVSWPSQRAFLVAVLLLLIAAGTVAYLVERAQHFTLMIVAVLNASAVARTMRGAVAWGIMAAFLAWLVDAGLAVTMLLAAPSGFVGQTELSLLVTGVLGPPVGYLIKFPLGVALLLILGTLVLREILVQVLWWRALRAAAML